MTTGPSATPRPKRARTPRSDGNGTKNDARPASTVAAKPTMSADQRHAMIAESAYRRAERRGFEGGDPFADWLESEREVDALLSRPTN